MNREIDLDISFSGYSIDTYGLFNSENDVDSIVSDYCDTTGRNIEYDDIEWEYDHKGYVQALAEKWCELMNENILDDVILGVKLKGEAWSPSYYNFSTDNCDATWLVDVEKLNEYIASHEKEYDDGKLKSRDGFIWFGDDDQTKLNWYIRAVSKKNYPSWDYANDVFDDDQVRWYQYIEHKLKV